jgi:hypothetical protein
LEFELDQRTKPGRGKRKRGRVLEFFGKSIEEGGRCNPEIIKE